MKKPVLYIVIPCYNEEDVLPLTSGMFLNKIDQLVKADKISNDSRVLFVNDGSKDRTWEIICDLAKKTFASLGSAGVCRIDFMMDADTKHVYVNEINTIPGFTSISMYPKLFAASGIPYGELIDSLLNLALEAC